MILQHIGLTSTASRSEELPRVYSVQTDGPVPFDESGFAPHAYTAEKAHRAGSAPRLHRQRL
jgi:hypothetical protein